MAQTQITTERLTLRPPEIRDAARIAALVGDLRVARWLTGVPHPYSEDDALRFVAEFGAPGKGTFLIRHEGEIAGCVSLRGELGYWIAVDHWGRGIATEAAGALVARHFAHSAEPLRSGYHLGNAASANVLTKLRFRPTHVEHDVKTAQGRTVSTQKMALSPEDWSAR